MRPAIRSPSAGRHERISVPSASVTDAHVRLAHLRNAGMKLANALETAAERLQVDGLAPACELPTQIREFACQWEDLARDVKWPVEATSGDTWLRLEQALDTAERDAAIRSTLDASERLAHRDGRDFAPLRQLRDLTDLWRSKLLVGAFALETAAALQAGEHGLPALVELVERGAELDDEGWEHRRELVERDLGHALALAAARGQLCLETDSASVAEVHSASPADENADVKTTLVIVPSTIPAKVESPAVVEPSQPTSLEVGDLFATPPSVAQQSELAAVDEPEFGALEATSWNDSVFDDFGATNSERRQLAKLDLRADLPHAGAAVVANAPNDLSLHMPASDCPANAVANDVPEPEPPVYSAELQRLARRAQTSVGAARGRQLAELAWRMLFDGYNGLAWQLTRVLDRSYGRGVAPASDVVRLWACSSRISEFNGPLAESFHHLAPICGLSSVSRDRDQAAAEQTLLQAALIRGVLFAPDSEAGPRLLALAEESGDTLLQRYVETLVQLDEHAEGRWAVDGSPTRDPLLRLQQRAGAWLQRLQRDTIAFRRAEPLFTQRHWSVAASRLQQDPTLSAQLNGWLHTLRMAEGLVRPILAHDGDAKPAVRLQAARIAGKLIVGARSDFPTGADAIIVPDAEMGVCLRRAAVFAQQWLSLGISAGAAEIDREQEFLALKEQLQERRDALLSKLQHAARHALELPLQTAIGCLMLALDEVTELVNGDFPVQAAEPTLEQLLSVELQGLRTVEIDRHGLPNCSDDDFLTRLLEGLDNPEAFWTRPVMEQPPLLPGVCAPQPRGESVIAELMIDDETASLDSASAMDERADWQAELDAMAHTLEAAVAVGRLSPHDGAAFQSRLWALQRAAGDRDLDKELQTLRRQLDSRGLAVPAIKSRRETSSVVNESVLMDDDP